jgi:hypothetical protein
MFKFLSFLMSLLHSITYRPIKRERNICKAFLLLNHVSYVDVINISAEKKRLDNTAILPTNLGPCSHSSDNETVEFLYE